MPTYIKPYGRSQTEGWEWDGKTLWPRTKQRLGVGWKNIETIRWLINKWMGMGWGNIETVWTFGAGRLGVGWRNA